MVKNPRHIEAHHTYKQIARDAAPIRAAIDAQFGAKPSAGIFHSLSGIANIHGAIEHGVRWDALVLVDPALNAPAGEAREAAHRFEQVCSPSGRGGGPSASPIRANSPPSFMRPARQRCGCRRPTS